MIDTTGTDDTAGAAMPDRAARPDEASRALRSPVTAPPVGAPLLEVRGLVKHYTAPRRWLRKARPPVQAVDGVSFTLARSETLALVGESGCGKTTTAKSVLRLVEPTAGSVRLDGTELTTLSAA
ncbi:MAG: ATP-binding cassette domain-containing protein, partial [Caldimonas sp.]